MTPIRSKRVSNYELFFDLAFVLTISQLTGAIHVPHVQLEHIFYFLTTIIVMLNVWNQEAFYYNKYGDSRQIDIYTVIVLMLLVGNLALSITFDPTTLNSFLENPLNFNSLLILSYGTIALQYVLKGRKLGFNKDIYLSIALLVVYALAVLPRALDLLPFSVYALPLYYLPLVVPLFLNSKKRPISMNFPHYLERCQLLTIITFGESVIAVLKTYPLAQHFWEGLTLFMGLGFMFVFYIIQTFININHHQRVSVKALCYAHYVIVASLLFFTVGLEFLKDSHHHDLGLHFFVLSILAFFVGTLSTSHYNIELYRLDRRVVVQYGLILLVAMGLFYLFGQQLALLGLTLAGLSRALTRTGMSYRRRVREQNKVPHPDVTANERDFS
ncbi:low temperature requirement protein A [Streptococcus sp. DD13]|uniref:low temperature requirement protein A n=1 Tax=Streptococcus sp. DD13 TaxID=1777881 RepID=UPI00079C589D|nr:low temperature requirement protein A [Streptococcus sp. DD13]KXT77923.1 putative low temperature requirement A protein [Streptococcus sp. DD13]